MPPPRGSSRRESTTWPTPTILTMGRRLVPAPGNGPIWARYYEIGTDRPIFGDRDKSIHDNVNEISKERRNGYSWYNQRARTDARTVCGLEKTTRTHRILFARRPGSCAQSQSKRAWPSNILPNRPRASNCSSARSPADGSVMPICSPATSSKSWNRSPGPWPKP